MSLIMSTTIHVTTNADDKWWIIIYQPISVSMLMMDFKASNTATIATIDKGSDRTFASAFFHPPASPTHVGCCVLNRAPARPPSEIYFESRGKCCKKLLRYNGYPNKVSIFPELLY
uniref:Uncharacterized protein n=1 Tax=Anopheles maculatus TaxID=74869 RepID=A0A182SI35_9DIPT